MSEQQKILKRVSTAIKINTADINAATVNATMCEVNINTYQKHLVELDRLHKIKLNSVQKAIDRYVGNLKSMHKTLDELLAEKEVLHEQLKEATHFGQIPCEYCNRYFTSQGIKRHRNTCISKPGNKAVEEHKAEIVDTSEDIESKKAELEKLYAQLGRNKKKE